jgi:hypothetical protein
MEKEVGQLFFTTIGESECETRWKENYFNSSQHICHCKAIFYLLWVQNLHTTRKKRDGKKEKKVTSRICFELKKNVLQWENISER